MLAVTTRNKLRSPRFCLPMLWARRQIRRQLEQTPGIVRFMTGVAGLTEFYSLTIWQSRADMFKFSASGSHRHMMWLFAKWSESFWSMRWQLTTEEIGNWDQLELSQGITEAPTGASDDPPDWLAHSQLAEVLAPYFDTTGRLDRRTFDPSHCDGAGVLARVVVRSPVEMYRLRQALHAWRVKSGLLQTTVAFDIGACLVITLWRTEALSEARMVMPYLKHHFPGSWAMRCAPGDYEIGHWDGLRLRQLGRSRTVTGRPKKIDL